MSQNLTLEKLGKNNKWFLLSIIILIIVSIFSAFLVVRSEAKHDAVKTLYAKSFVSFNKLDFYKKSKNKQADIEKTISLLKEVVKTKTSYLEYYLALYNLAAIYALQFDTKNATLVLEEIQKADKDLLIKPQAMTKLARIYEKSEKWDKAIEVYQQMADDYKNDQKNFALYQLGLIYTKTGKIKEAINSYSLIPISSSFFKFSKRNISVIKALSSKER